MQHDAEQQHGAHGGPEARHRRPELPDAQLRAFDLGLEVLGLDQLQRDAGKVAGELIGGEDELTLGGIADVVARAPQAGRDAGENDEVVQVPMQDGGERQLRQVANFAPQRASGKADRLRDGHYLFEGCTLERDGVMSAEGGEIGLVAMCGCNNRQAG